jgi:hypothetical protein
MIAYVCVYRSTSLVPGTPTIANTGTGGATWGTVVNQTTGTYYKTAYCYKTIATDSDGSVTAYTWSSSSATQMLGAIQVFSGRMAQAPTPISNTAYVTSNTIVRAASLTAAAGDDLSWWGYWRGNTVDTLTIPSGFTGTDSLQAAGQLTAAVGRLDNVSSGATGDKDGAAGVTTATKHSFMLAMQKQPVATTFDPMGLMGFYGM